MHSIPERSLEPAEDRRQVVANCVCCGEEIREGDDCYDLPGVGYVCERCVDRAYIIEIEA